MFLGRFCSVFQSEMHFQHFWRCSHVANLFKLIKQGLVLYTQSKRRRSTAPVKNWQNLLPGWLGLLHTETERSQRNPGYRILSNENARRKEVWGHFVSPTELQFHCGLKEDFVSSCYSVPAKWKKNQFSTYLI